MAIDIHALSDLMRQDRKITIEMAGCALELDLSIRHERHYACKYLTYLPYPQSDVDTMLIEYLVRPGDRVLDAGANIGFTALEFLEAGASEVVAIEPVSSLFGRLEKIADPRIRPIKAAVSDRTGAAQLHISQTHNQGSTLKTEIIGIFPQIFGDETEIVPLTTIDRIAADHGPFDIWKIDIEGAEVECLDGAVETLSGSPPRAIIVELYEPFLRDFLDRISATHGYGYRAFIREADYALMLMPVDTQDLTGFCQHSPMYVFMREPLSV